MADLAHLPRESRQDDGLGGLLHRADDQFPGAVRISGVGARPAPHRPLQRDRPPHRAWTTQQLREAFPFDQVPRYLLRDRDGVFGNEFRSDVKAMGITEVFSTPQSPWE